MAQKIFIVLPSLQGGGAERLHIHLATAWERAGHSVEFLLMQKTGDLISLLPPQIPVADLGCHRIREIVGPLARRLRGGRPDIVLAAIWPLTSAVAVAWLLSGRCGRLFLSDHNPLSTACVQELQVPRWALSSSLGATYRLATGIIAVSHGVKVDICRLGRLRPDRVKVIHNPAATGVAAERESIEVQERLWGSGFERRILSVGTLRAAKDHATLIRAFSRLPRALNAKLTILGDGPLRPDLERLIVTMGLEGRVALPGFVLDPYPWFRSADLFVLSSRWEGFGNVIVEALECGVPVVSTDCPGGPAEILEHGRYGRLVPVGCEAAMAAGISDSLTRPHDVELLMRRARDFSVEAISGQYLAYFSQAGAADTCEDRAWTENPTR